LGSRRSAAYRISARAPTRREERGRTPRRTPPIFTRAALPAEGGHRSAWVAEGVSTEAEASESRPRRESGRASSTRAQPWIPTTKCVGMTAARCPAPCAGRAQPRERRGRGRSRGGPERRNAPRGGGSDGAWKERGHRVSRATRSGARISVAARQRRAKGEGKAAARGASSGAVAPRLRGAKGGRAMGA